MELKLARTPTTSTAAGCLNRTFYGIETLSEELPRLSSGSLNRTFYGIATVFRFYERLMLSVLIVPFMELKHGINVRVVSRLMS